jgi:hypothetical protein
MTAVTPTYEDADNGIKELILFHATFQGWLNPTVHVLRASGAVGTTVQMPGVSVEGKPTVVEHIELSDQIEHVTPSGLHRIIKMGYGEKTNTIVFVVGGIYHIVPANVRSQVRND